ncbi:hypothetical protein R1flu_018927 [Riccia fluitans]|uniref:Uncharacterized protein n=1 Tax=Riccia fluitans TaxID=41844 RepID=A0ABD1ZKM6_9MARC
MRSLVKKWHGVRAPCATALDRSINASHKENDNILPKPPKATFVGYEELEQENVKTLSTKVEGHENWAGRVCKLEQDHKKLAERVRKVEEAK